MAHDSSMAHDGYAKDTLRWIEIPVEFTETIESLFQISNELILALGLDNNVVNVDFNVAM